VAFTPGFGPHDDTFTDPEPDPLAPAVDGEPDDDEGDDAAGAAPPPPPEEPPVPHAASTTTKNTEANTANHR
jgi:hypothetical protein